MESTLAEHMHSLSHITLTISFIPLAMNIDKLYRSQIDAKVDDDGSEITVCLRIICLRFVERLPSPSRLKEKNFRFT